MTHCSRTPPIPSLQVLRMQISGSRHANSLLGGSRAALPSVQQHVPILPDLRELQLDSTEWPPWAYKQTLRAAVSLTRLSLSLCHSLPNVNFLKHATALRALNISGDPLDSHICGQIAWHPPEQMQATWSVCSLV